MGSLIRSKWFLAVMLLAWLAFFACGCGDDDDDDSGPVVTDDDDDDDSVDDDDDDSTPDDDDDDDSFPDVDDLIAEGKDWLALPDGARARLFFQEALDIAPGHPEAMYGLILSDTAHAVDIFSIIADYVMSVIDYGGPVKSDFSGDDLINNMLRLALDGLLRSRAVELVETAPLALEAGATFEHPGIPLYVNYENVMTLQGQFQEAEIYASVAFVELMSGLLYHMYALDLDFDLSHIFRYEGLDTDSMTTTEIVSAFVEMFLDMLTDPAYPDFLTLPEGNAAMFREAGIEVGDALDAWLKVFPSIDIEITDQSDDVMGYADWNANLRKEGYEPYFIPGFGELDEETMALNNDILLMVEGLRDSFWDYTAKDADPDNPNPFQLELVRPLVQAAGLPAFLIPKMEVDIGMWYVDAVGDNVKQTLVTILKIVDLFLPDYAW